MAYQTSLQKHSHPGGPAIEILFAAIEARLDLLTAKTHKVPIEVALQYHRLPNRCRRAPLAFLEKPETGERSSALAKCTPSRE